MPDLRLLRYFVAVADELNFTRASARLFVSTPTLSSGVKALERELGVTLFERDSRSVLMTDHGRALLPQAREVLLGADRLLVTARGLAGRATLRGGTVTGYAGAFLLETAAELRSRGVDVDLVPHAASWTEPTAGLIPGTTDLAVLIGPTAADHRLDRTRLWDEERVAVLPETLALPDPSSVTVAELDAVGWLWCRTGDECAHAYWRLDDLRGGPPRAARLVDDPQELFLAIRAGAGVCTTPAGFREQFGFGGLQLVPVAGSPPVAVDAACHATDERPLVRSFLATMQQLAAEHSPLA